MSNDHIIELAVIKARITKITGVVTSSKNKDSYGNLVVNSFTVHRMLDELGMYLNGETNKDGHAIHPDGSLITRANPRIDNTGATMF